LDTLGASRGTAQSTRGRGSEPQRPHVQIEASFWPVMSNILVEVARKEARRRLEARGVDAGVIDRLPSIEDGFVVWLSRSGMPMEAVDDLMQARGGYVDRVQLENVVRETTGHEPPAWVLDLLMTSMDASGDGRVSSGEMWRWAAARGLDVPESLLADPVEPDAMDGASTDAAVEDSIPHESEDVEATHPEMEVQNEATVDQPAPEPAAAQPVPPSPVAVASVDDLASVFHALGQNKRGVEIEAAVAANRQRFLISGVVTDERTTLLGEPGWRRGRTVGVNTEAGMVDLQLPEEAEVPSRSVTVEASLAGWNRGLARPVFRIG
jgi:hypothetical protein